MTNFNDAKIELGLDVNIGSQWKKNCNTGAGANANSKAGLMNYVGSDTLAELVWSRQTGLNIKLFKQKPCSMWKEGPSEIRPVASLATRHVSDEVAKSSGCTGSQNQVAADTLFQQLLENGMINVNDSGSDRRSRLKSEPMIQVNPFLENAQVSIFENENDKKHEAASHGSMGTCRTANFLTQRKRKCSFEQHVILGSKRITKEADEYATKTDHSFMNWISDMFKGSLNHVIQESLDLMEIQNEMAPSLVKHVSLYKGVSEEAPKGMFDTIRRLRLSRTEIHKWVNSQLPVAHLDGFFLRLRVAEWEEGSQGSRYYVASIAGLQREATWKDLKQPIRVKVGEVECFVESQHVSNCDFIEDELIAWWQKTSKNQRIPVVKDLKSKLAMRRTLDMLFMEKLS